MKQFSVLIIVLFLAIPGFAQRGYYRTDSMATVGIELMDLGISNSYFCSVKKRDNVVKYTPFEIREYAFDEGKFYKAFDIVIDGKKDRYFLEQIVNGNIKLYNLKLKGGINKYYVLQADSSNLQELSSDKQEAQNLIHTFVDDCPQAAENLKYLRPNKHSLTRYLNYLNSCSDYPYPKIQYGFKVGIAGTQFYPIDGESNYAIPEYKSDISFTINAFIDLPMLSGNISFAPEIYYKGNHYLRSFVNSNESFDLILNYSSLSFPLLFKYSFLRKENVPFITLGPIYSRVINDHSALYKFKVVDNDVFLDVNDSPVIQKNMGGFSIGTGLILNSEKKYRWFGEVRYNYLMNLIPGAGNFNLSEFSINTGILF